MNRSLDLPDKTLQFIRDRPLMDEAARPLTGGPLLVRRGALLTRIVVDSVLALDGQRHAVMFIGTGWSLAGCQRFGDLLWTFNTHLVLVWQKTVTYKRPSTTTGRCLSLRRFRRMKTLCPSTP